MPLTPAEKQRRFRERRKQLLAAIVPQIPTADPATMTLAAIRAEHAQHRKTLADHPLQQRVDVLAAEIERRRRGKTV